MPFLENMTLRICFIIELFLSRTRITLDQHEKESTSINKSPTPVMYAWSICTRLHSSTYLNNECKVVCVKFLNSLHFLHLFIYSLPSHEYPAHHTSNFILFVCSCYFTVDIIMYTFLSLIFFVFLGELSDPHYKLLHVLSLTYVLFLCRVFLPWNNFPIRFFLILDVILLSTGPCLVSAAILSKAKHQSLPNVKMYLQILLFYLFTPCKIAILIVHLRVELNFFWHIPKVKYY